MRAAVGCKAGRRRGEAAKRRRGDIPACHLWQDCGTRARGRAQRDQRWSLRRQVVGARRPSSPTMATTAARALQVSGASGLAPSPRLAWCLLLPGFQGAFTCDFGLLRWASRARWRMFAACGCHLFCTSTTMDVVHKPLSLRAYGDSPAGASLRRWRSPAAGAERGPVALQSRAAAQSASIVGTAQPSSYKAAARDVLTSPFRSLQFTSGDKPPEISKESRLPSLCFLSDMRHARACRQDAASLAHSSIVL